MATRLYPVTQSAPSIWHGKSNGSWGIHGFTRSYSPVQWNWVMGLIKNGTLSTRTFSTNQQGNYDFYFWRFLVGPFTGTENITGTLDWCFMVQAQWQNGAAGPTNDSVVRFKVHSYVTVGATTAVRGNLINNHVDSVNWPGTSGPVWRSFAAPVAVTNQTANAGDYVIIEIGARVVSSPTPAPVYDPPNDSFYTNFTFRGTGSNQSGGTINADAVAGDTSLNRAPWIEFSHTFGAFGVSAPPLNDACADAIAIASLPYESADIDATQSADTDKALWWTFTAPTAGLISVHTFKSNYFAYPQIYTGSCGALSLVSTPARRDEMGQNRSLSSYTIQASAGTQYWIKVENRSGTNSTPATNGYGGGVCHLNVYYKSTAPVENDLYLANGYLLQIRAGKIVNFHADFISEAPTGIAIDYTKRVMDDINGGTNSNERMLMALHNFELVEILDLPTLSYGIGQSEIDFIGDPWAVFPDNIHPAQSYITRAGMLYQMWFGNGYLYISGGGIKPAVLNAISDDVSYPALKVIDATHGDSQPGAPYTDVVQVLGIEHYCGWAGKIDEATNILYYTSGGFYIPVPGATTMAIKRWNVATQMQLADFATITLSAGSNPGLKGLCLLPGGGLLVCNSTVVHRLNAAGAIITTYTPSIPDDSQSLCDIVLLADGLSFWVVDELTTRIFRFDLAAGTELESVQPYGLPGSLVQMQIYQPVPPGPPSDLSGIYVIEVNKTNDTVYLSTDPEVTEVRKIPDPFIKTGFLGD